MWRVTQTASFHKIQATDLEKMLEGKLLFTVCNPRLKDARLRAVSASLQGVTAKELWLRIVAIC